MRFEVSGTSPTTTRAKVWLASAAEPAAWRVSAADSTSGYQVAGSVGLRAYLSGTATNSPVVAKFDDLLVGPAH